MKKILCALLSAAAVSMCLAGCQKKSENGFMTVESDTCNYTFACPESWTVSYTDGMLSAYNPEDISKANVTAFSFSHGLESTPSATEYWTTYEKQLCDTFGTVSVSQLNEKALGGQNVAHAEYSVSIGGEKFECETVLVVYESDVYTLTLTQGAKTEQMGDNYNDHSDEFEEIVKTFRIK